MSAFNHTDRAGTSRRDAVAATLLNGIGAILWEADARTFAFKFVSREAEQVLGYPVEQWLNEPDFWRAHTHEEDVGWCSVFCADAAASGRDHTFEYRMLAADGRIVWIRDIVTVETAADGTPLLRGVMIDVSDWHRADEQQRARLQGRARATFEDAPIGMAVVDLDARPLDTNAALQRLLGYTAEELRDLTIPQITHPHDITRDAELYAELLSGRRDHYQLEKRLVRKDGSVVWCKLTASLVRDAHGRPEYGVGMVEDITERKDLEARLLQRQKMEAVGRLAGGIAHDFNNLLTVIRGYSDVLMLGRADDDSVRSDAAEIRHAAERAAALIQQLLAFSRKQQLFPVLVDVNEIVDDVAVMLRRLIGEHITFETRLAGEPLRVLADRGQIQQMLVNLALNARDAMPMGGTLTIETRRACEAPGEQASVTPEECVALVVTDTGVGISDDVLPRIFEPFFTTKDVGHGTGLGLATAYGIVEQSGGHITVTSRPGDGSTFTVFLPPASPTPAEGAARPAHVASPSGKATILLVEDEDSVRRLAKHTLELEGYRVLDAARGREALTIAHANGASIDLIVTDIVMPAMSGPEMVRQFRTVHGRVPVVYMSGYADTSTFQAGELARDETFLAKPFHAGQLDACVKKVLRAARI